MAERPGVGSTGMGARGCLGTWGAASRSAGERCGSDPKRLAVLQKVRQLQAAEVSTLQAMWQVHPPYGPSLPVGAELLGENNTKFFILFLFYATTTCLYYSVCVIWFLWDFMSRKVQQRARFHEVSGYLGLLLGTEIIVICLTLMLGSLCWWNVYLMVRNQTSIENYDIEAAPSRHRVRGKRLKHRYDMGTFKNMQSVLGHSPLLWLLPVSKDPPPSGSSSRGNECDDERLEMQGILPPQPAE
eukprot:CAMPEP_0181313252 /NCGR_PEP_ID=MMETSP1101-20121128/14149_1 /TAXON_ID=46948 /ORGANISM="Rhodomonas abbreviata, Strain Caron Lab Isolate" /LENGTH=242 /DNA_ID=CAMNT_0023420193 /DNA_START=286 /DNA_END=1015 /DNA_ORIENTATION=+